MGSIQRKKLFERLHKRYGEKYPELDVKEIREIRSRFLNVPESTKDHVIKSYIGHVENLEAHLKEGQERLKNKNKALEWLTHCSEEQFNDLVEKNPKI